MGMPENFVWQYGPSTLWVMAGTPVAQSGTSPRASRTATPLPVAVTAAGLVSGPRLGNGVAGSGNPQVAQWDAIRSHYQDVADWIDHDAARPQTTVAPPKPGGPGYLWRNDMADYLGVLDSKAKESVRRDNVAGWLSAKPDYWVTAGKSVDAATTALPEFRREYQRAATIGPLNIYRRTATED